MTERMVAITQEQADILEDVGVALMRLEDDRAMKVLAISLAYKFANPIGPPLPDNVVDITDRIRAYSRSVG